MRVLAVRELTVTIAVIEAHFENTIDYVGNYYELRWLFACFLLFVLDLTLT